jgi:alpha-mannosidase/mannosylglycerate hydrolase
MEQDPEYRYFMMDGQVLVLKDYLEVRPENRPRVESLVKAGRLLVGPWYSQPNEYMVSGESMIRNLLLGIRESEALAA